MTDVLIDSMTYTVETYDLDLWAEYNEDTDSHEPKTRWTGVQSHIKTYAEADAFAQKLLEVYRKVRITKTVKYVESVFGE
ncbi:MAG: hypothetical protein ABR585_13970 [Gemmatimonadaceae bacterium]|nr:hypothetical protein [Actinomycetota bacterium]